MKPVWKKVFLAVLLVSGLFLSAPAAEARKHHHHCSPYAERGWYHRGRNYNYNPYYGQREWYGGWQRPYYDNDYYPSRYPYRPYADRPYYGGYPWWSIFSGR